jgi:hypothetical protein
MLIEIMENNFDELVQMFTKAGLDVRTAEYNITEYSLNSELSFKFENIDHLISFLDEHGDASEQAKENINALLVKEGLDPDKPFYVNFFKPKVAEL